MSRCQCCGQDIVRPALEVINGINFSDVTFTSETTGSVEDASHAWHMFLKSALKPRIYKTLRYALVKELER